MSIWVDPPSLHSMNEMSADNMLAHLGIEFTAIDDEGLVGSMPVDSRTTQPFGLLHGGASVVLAETLASMASNFTLDRQVSQAVGLEVNANHIRAVRSGLVFGKATPIHLGRSTQVWEVRITSNDRLASIHRITMAIVDRRASI